jgi:cytochrome P450
MASHALTIGSLFAILLLAHTLIQFIQRRRVASKFARLHGCQDAPAFPQSERLLGLALMKESKAASASHHILETMRQRYEVMGPTYTCGMLGGHFINTIDPENIQAVLAKNFKDFGLGQRKHTWGPLLGEGIFTTDGAHWEHSRAIVRPNFVKSQIVSLGMFEGHVQELIEKIPRDGSTVDLQTLFFNMTLDSSTEFLFGESIRSQHSYEGSDAEKFSTAFDFAQHQMPGRNRMGGLVRFIPDKAFHDACKVVQDWGDRYVAKALVNLEKEKDDDVKERYTFMAEMAKQTPDPIQLRNEVLNILLAGRDTTAGLLSNVFHALARHPRVWEKLKAEIDTLEGRIPDYECLRNMHYLKWVLNECKFSVLPVARSLLKKTALRLFPPVPTNARFAYADTCLPRGGGPSGLSPVFVPKGSIIMYSVFSMHRRTDIFGADALEFKPERWAPDAPSGPLRPGWGFLPFNGGPRICVGQQYALTEASYTIVRLLQTFGELESRDQNAWVEGYGLTLCSGKGTKVALTPR